VQKCAKYFEDSFGFSSGMDRPRKSTEDTKLKQERTEGHKNEDSGDAECGERNLKHRTSNIERRREGEDVFGEAPNTAPEAGALPPKAS
jgi:hypothetical protein